MAFGRKVQHGARAMGGEEPGNERAVADVTMHEHVARVVRKRGEACEIARVAQLVQVEHRLAVPAEPGQDEVRADETCAAGDENHASGAAQRAERGGKSALRPIFSNIYVTNALMAV